MNHRNVMIQILAARASEGQLFETDKAALIGRYEADLLASAEAHIKEAGVKLRAKKGEARLATVKRLLPDLTVTVLHRYEDIAKEMNDRYWAYLDRTNKLLTRLAQKARVEPGEERRVTEVCSTSYNSQGWGAGNYAKNDAQTYVDRAEQTGAKARVEEVQVPFTMSKGSYLTFVVWASVKGEVDVEIIKRRNLNLKEWIRTCWARGVNPRVYNPYLPVGLEERLGLDYFGNEIKKVS